VPHYAAFFRGINVGGKHMVPMTELRALFEDAGATEVRSYLQSGNVVFRTATSAARMASAVEAALERRFRFSAPIVVRTRVELAAVLANNPYLRPDSEPAKLHVLFLSDTPAARAVAALDPKRSPPDEFSVRGREIYLSLPNGSARTKLTTSYFDSALAVTSTARNWRTVTALHDMLAESR